MCVGESIQVPLLEGYFEHNNMHCVKTDRQDNDPPNQGLNEPSSSKMYYLAYDLPVED